MCQIQEVLKSQSTLYKPLIGDIRVHELSMEKVEMIYL